MNNNDEYCTVCGKQHIEFTGTWFDRETGMKRAIMACPDACSHGHHVTESYHPRGFIENIKMLNEKCVCCGNKFNNEC